MDCHCCKVIKVAGKLARIALWLPSKGWYIHSKGYLIYTSNSKTSGIKRGTRAHRAAIEKLLGHPLAEDKHVHHQDFDKLNNCPLNLLYTDSVFNPAFACRDPYTGEYMSPATWQRRYGYSTRREMESDVPDWVTGEFIESMYATIRV